MLKLLIGLQSLTFVACAAVFALQGHWRLGGAQILLAVVNTLVYL